MLLAAKKQQQHSQVWGKNRPKTQSYLYHYTTISTSFHVEIVA